MQMRVGVNTGGVLAAGGAAPGEPMVTGDVVNTAARLQTAAEPGEILLGAPVDVFERVLDASLADARRSPMSPRERGQRE